ncbi:MAG: hypothetical protein ACI4IW_07840 [Oscillospiraceae bacterium]
MENRTCGLDYEAEYERCKVALAEAKCEIQYLMDTNKELARRNEILEAQIAIIYLIFGGSNHG